MSHSVPGVNMQNSGTLQDRRAVMSPLDTDVRSLYSFKGGKRGSRSQVCGFISTYTTHHSGGEVGGGAMQRKQRTGGDGKSGETEQNQAETAL